MDTRQHLAVRRDVVFAMVYAAEHPHLVVDVSAGTRGGVSAVGSAMASALGISEQAARVVLDMQIRRFSPESLGELRSELSKVDSAIASLDAAE